MFKLAFEEGAKELQGYIKEDQTHGHETYLVGAF